MWYQNSTLCETPRTCYDCLNTALYSGQKCAITPGGYCTTIEAFDFALDYRRVHSDSAAHFFPSTNTTYCEDDDVACAKCRVESFVGAYSGKTNLSAYCTAWKEMHNGLIADERNDENEGHRLADVPDDAPMVTVEEGGGYRPMSPSVPVLPAAPPSPNRSSSTPTLSQTQRVSI
ncbi:hypothetical protein PInf_024695 [Phytophthora infestans]|nr:hypothetical protein PInf_024695 [Phytophthora infestans]